MSERTRWNEKYLGEHGPRRVNERLKQFAPRLKVGRLLDLAGGTGQNAAWLVQQNREWQPVVADISDAGLGQSNLPRVLCDAATLPFAHDAFDSILCIRFYEPRIHFADWLAPDGTVFFETFTTADGKYRPDFNPAHRFDLARIDDYFRGLEIVVKQETDDGRRVYVTVVARKTA